MATKLRIPIITFKDGLADAVKQRLLATDSPARALFQAGRLEFVTLPLPTFPPSHGVLAAAPGAKVHVEEAELVETKWELSKDQQEVLEQATVVLGDAHNCAPLLLAPETGLPKSMQHLLKNVQWVQGTYAGVERYLALRDADAPPPPFKLTRAGGIDGLAQYVFGWVITFERKFHEAHAMQQQKLFEPRSLHYRPFQSVTVGILGLGAIGQAIGRLAKLAGFNVLGFKRKLRGDEDEKFKSCAHRVSTDLDEVLQASDYIVSILPSTPATKYLLNETNLPLCSKKKPVFLNVGRGDVIAEQTIVMALNNQWFSKAVVDVFEKEPLPDDSQLWDHPKVFMTPHVAAYCFNEDVADVFVSNLNAYLANKPLQYLVDWVNGY
ncbi:Glyoxylate/hydroxypyruvate reductase A [Phytophthora cinnamomi]|uniref:Glyoxylate/hydroxypyruvate reductase A n=1 Tax=Phytophthora cinnamomi TaxID=4785 RepID=UPI00355A5C74|nr:Glyoxylate/hydroxypyruvate reductase A [Phytophthora cinnamomi]